MHRSATKRLDGAKHGKGCPKTGMSKTCVELVVSSLEIGQRATSRDMLAPVAILVAMEVAWWPGRKPWLAAVCDHK